MIEEPKLRPCACGQQPQLMSKPYERVQVRCACGRHTCWYPTRWYAASVWNQRREEAT